MINRSQFLSLVRDAFIFSLPLLIAQLYFKYTYLRYGGMEILERAIDTSNLGLMQYLSLYALDIAETFVVLPLLLIIAGLLASKFKFVLFQMVTGVLLLAGVISWTAYHVIGSFPNPSLVVDYFQTLWIEPEIVSPFNVLTTAQLIKAAAILSIGFIPFLFRNWLSRNYLRGTSAIFLLALLLLPVVVFSVTEKQATIFHQGNIQRMVVSMLPDSDVELPDSAGLNIDVLKKIYQNNVYPGKNVVTGPAAGGTVTVAKKTKPNVVFVVLETASLADYNIFSSKVDMPHTSALLKNSLITKKHFSAYPYSIRANFSMFSSIYDMPTRDMMVDFLIDENPITSDALPQVLSREGYVVKYYFPVRLTQGDKERWMLKYLGFDELWEGLKQANTSAAKSRVTNEELMFDEAIKDIAAFSDNSTPFFLSLVTAIGHAPFPAFDENNQLSRSQKIMALKKFLDGLIGKLTASLKKAGQLDNTILVITGDHGVRNKVEDPSINLAYSNHRSYSVPLLIHYPPVFKQVHEVDWVTSHIDVAPTVLSLMGHDASKYLYQGESVLNESLKERVTFFWGGHYFGTNSLHHKGNYYMENIVTGVKLISDDFMFENNGADNHVESVTYDAYDINYTDIMSKQKSIQYKWAAYMRGRD